MIPWNPYLVFMRGPNDEYLLYVFGKSLVTTVKFGPVCPGIKSQSPFFQSLTSGIAGCVISPGVSCMSGVITTSFIGFDKCFSASLENFFAMNANASQSLFASQFGATAAPIG